MLINNYLRFHLLKLCFLFALLCPFSLIAQEETDHWEAVFLDGTIWSYLVPDSQPDSTWMNPDFDDSDWEMGQSGFGYSDGDDSTIVEPTMSIYLRHKFFINDIEELTSAIFYMDYDDGFIAYLNGVEIARGNAGEEGDFIAWNENLATDHEAVIYSGGTPSSYYFDFNSLLIEGQNIIAIETHNANPTSSDLTARPFLIIGTNSEEFTYEEVPTWFESIELPCASPNYIVQLNTGSWAGEVQWYIEYFGGEVVAESDGGYSNYSEYQQIICLEDTCYNFWMVDTYGDGWNGGSFELQDLSGNVLLSGELPNGYQSMLSFTLGGECDILGCTDPDAINFWEYATVDDSTCVFADESNLPIIKLFTDEEIPDDPRIIADMEIINNVDSSNHINDPANEYDGLISVEIRGSSSQMFPKKSYALETQDSLGANNNVSLLGMPEENDWILHGPYTDKTLMRNSVIFHMGQMVDRYTPRSRYCELYINGDYRGVYMLMENIKRDDNRVDIATLLPTDTIGDELTGGYILKVDKLTGDFNGGWHSPYPTFGGEELFIQYHKPELEDLHTSQAEYIQNHITDFEDALAGDDFTDYELGYYPYIDIPSFIDLYLINEFSKNIDGYRLSTYFYKQKDSNGGKIVMGPWWDYNLSLGNANYCDASDTDGFEVNTGCGSSNPFWFEKLLEDPNYSNMTRCVWEDYRANEWSDESVHGLIDSLEILLADASVRDHVRWPRLGQYIWPNAFIGQTYEEEIQFMRDWIDERLIWLDENIAGTCIAGCTDPNACNYVFDANYNDGSCEYQSCNCIYDLDDDGIISIYDILITLSEFGCYVNCSADLNGDGSVSVDDLLIVLSQFGTNC